MFESTLEAQGLNDGERRFGSLSAAAVAHLAIGIGIVAATALIVPPIKVPEPAVSPFVIIPQVRLDLESPKVPEAKPPKGERTPKGGGAPAPQRIEPNPPPRETPSDLPQAVDPVETPGIPGPDDGRSGQGGRTGEGDTTGNGTGPIGEPDGIIDGPVYVTGEMVRPVLVTKVEPLYPEVARRAGLGGRVTVSAVIGLDGGVESVQVLGSTNPLFDRAAVDAVTKWRYRPATMNGKPVRVYFSVVVDFVVR